MTDNVRNLRGVASGPDGAEFDAEGIVTDAAGYTIREHPGNPYDVAVEFIEEWDGARCYWRGDFYKHNGSRWVVEDRQDVMREVNADLGASLYRKVVKEKVQLHKWSPNNTSLANLEKQLGFHAGLPNTQEPVRGGEFIFLEGGRYSVSTGVMLPPDKSLFNLHASPVKYNRKAKCPEFDRFLKGIFGGDQDSIDRHLLWMAYELTGATDLQKGYILLGETRSGKSTAMDINDALIGKDQTTGMSLSDLAKEFGLAPMVGKSVARFNDARTAGKDPHLVAEKILSIIGEDVVQVNRKRVDHWVGKLGVRLTMCSNLEFPLPDAAGVVTDRFHFNRTVGSHKDSVDVGLGRRIIGGEMPGVLNRVLEYVDKIYLPWPEPSEAVVASMRSMKQASQPLDVWAMDCNVELVAMAETPFPELWESYCAWAHENGYPKGNAQAFARELRAWAPALRDARRGAKGKQVVTYIGIQFAG